MSVTGLARAVTPPDPHEAYLRKGYFTELDGLRAVSALLVVTAHLYDRPARWWWLAGERGVTIFFVLSGWLITTLALREEGRRGRLCLSAFYVRRCFRILPLYYVTLALYGLLVFALPFSPHLRAPLAEGLPYFLLYLQEVRLGLWELAHAPEMVFGHSWTLGVEEKFYLLWPLLGFVAWRGGGPARVRGTAALALLLGLLPAALRPLGPEAAFVGRMLMSYSSLLAGCLLALLLHDPAWFARLRRLGRPGPTAAALLLFLACHFASPWAPPAAADALNASYTLAVAALLACLLTGEGLPGRCLRWGPLAFVGRVSYGVYLTHLLAIGVVSRAVPLARLGWAGSLLNFALVSGLSVLGAWALRSAVEAPCIEWGRRWSRRMLGQARPSPDGGEGPPPTPQPRPVSGSAALAGRPHAPRRTIFPPARAG